MRYPQTDRDVFHQQAYGFDAGRSPAVDEQLLARGREPVIEDPEVAHPMEVVGKAGGPDPFEPHRQDEQIVLCDPGSHGPDVSFL